MSDSFDFSFRGRVARGSYWKSLLMVFAIRRLFNDETNWPWVGFSAAFYAMATWLLASSVVRRLHDLGFSGWWAVPLTTLPMVAVFAMLGLDAVGLTPSEHLAVPLAVTAVWGELVVLGGAAILGFIPGSVWPNRFGTPPKRGRPLGWLPRS